MADIPETQDIPSSYQAITAITIAELIGMDLAMVTMALKSKNSNLIRLELETSRGVVENNQRLASLDIDRETLSQFIDNLILSFTDVKNTPLKNPTEDQTRERESTLKKLDKDLNEIKAEAKKLDQNLVYLYDVNEDNQKRYRDKVTRSIQNIAKLNKEVVEIIMKHLQTLEINVKDSDTFIKELMKSLNHPDLQTLYLNEASDGSGKGFTQKLKEWFR